MDTRTQIPHTLPPGPKRKMRFLRFALKPGDEQLLERLTDGQRDLLLSDGSYQEKAQRFGLPIGTVRSRLHRARAALELLRQDQADKPFTKENATLN